MVKYQKGGKMRRRLVRKCYEPSCSERRKDLLRACANCQVAVYCSEAHQRLDYTAHRGLCQEVTRLCDHQDCRKVAKRKCSKCKCIVYCSEDHERAHAEAHKELCDQLTANGKRFR